MLANVTPTMEIFTEQVCGPVARVTPFDTDEEAVSLANTVPDLAAAYIWTSDLQRAHRLAPAIESPTTWVNSHNPRDLQAVSAGQTGAEAGQVGIDFFTHSRLLIAADDTPVPRLGV